MAASSRLDAFQRRHVSVGFPIAVFYKFFDDQGTYLAALITYYAFLSLFPVLLLLASLLGFFLQGHPAWQQELIGSALNQFPVVGSKLARPAGLRGSATGDAVAFVVALYGALGVAQAVQNAMNVSWAVPRNKRPNPLLLRLRSLLLLATAGLTLVGTTVVSTLAGSGAFGSGRLTNVLFYALSIALNAGVLVLTLRLATALPLTLAEVLPGALVGGVAWKLLQQSGASYVNHVVRGATDSDGTSAVVFGLVAWIFLLAITLVLVVEVNVVHSRRLHPRALLTPFTDQVDLTPADLRAYTQYAQAQRNKGFQRVEVTFDHDGQYATATRDGAVPACTTPPAELPDETPDTPPAAMAPTAPPAVRDPLDR